MAKITKQQTEYIKENLVNLILDRIDEDGWWEEDDRKTFVEGYEDNLHVVCNDGDFTFKICLELVECRISDKVKK